MEQEETLTTVPPVPLSKNFVQTEIIFTEELQSTVLFRVISIFARTLPTPRKLATLHCLLPFSLYCEFKPSVSDLV